MTIMIFIAPSLDWLTYSNKFPPFPIKTFPCMYDFGYMNTFMHVLML